MLGFSQRLVVCGTPPNPGKFPGILINLGLRFGRYLKPIWRASGDCCLRYFVRKISDFLCAPGANCDEARRAQPPTSGLRRHAKSRMKQRIEQSAGARQMGFRYRPNRRPRLIKTLGNFPGFGGVLDTTKRWGFPKDSWDGNQ